MDSLFRTDSPNEHRVLTENRQEHGLPRIKVAQHWLPPRTRTTPPRCWCSVLRVCGTPGKETRARPRTVVVVAALGPAGHVSAMLGIVVAVLVPADGRDGAAYPFPPEHRIRHRGAAEHKQERDDRTRGRA